jgi:hypothetical protein
VCSIALAIHFGAAAMPAPTAGQGAMVSGNPAPTADQIHSLIMRAIENQHRDDRALEEFERTEHVVTRKAENSEILTDISQRVVPSPAGNIKLKLVENGVAIPPDVYRQELEAAVNSLDLTSHPTDRYKEDLAKYEKRRRDHAELVDAAAKAFRVTWAGRETRSDAGGTRTLMKLLLDPDPEFKPTNRLAVVFQHMHATLWVDESAAQFARLEGDVASDIPFAGGIAGKVYRGGHVLMVQEEVAPDIWLPTQFDYNVEGRKFIVGFVVHEHTDLTHYRRVGPPQQAAESLRNELNSLTTANPAR